MRRLWVPALLLALVLATFSQAGAGTFTTVAEAAAPPVHAIAVTGPEVTMAPAYDPAIRRYALRTGPGSTGTVTVTASTSDPSGQVRVNGRPVTGGATTLTGLVPGDEISVLIDDSAGTAVHSLIYLPAAYPDLEGSGPVPGLAPGDLLLTLNAWNANPDRFHSVVDDYGVPKWFRREPVASHDLRLQPNGHFSQAVATTSPGRDGVDIVEMNDRFEEIARHRTVGLVNTDFHDSLLRADGSEVLIAYEVSDNGLAIDARIQEINPDGSVFMSWNSGDHVNRNNETVVDLTDPWARFDYAHINSVTMTPDGNYLASFRGLSAVFKIARTAHDGYAQGDVIWRLGGRLSDFTFPNDPYGGPCAQHTASMLPNGHVVIFDNGSDDLNDQRSRLLRRPRRPVRAHRAAALQPLHRVRPRRGHDDGHPGRRVRRRALRAVHRFGVPARQRQHPHRLGCGTDRRRDRARPERPPAVAARDPDRSGQLPRLPRGRPGRLRTAGRPRRTGRRCDVRRGVRGARRLRLHRPRRVRPGLLRRLDHLGGAAGHQHAGHLRPRGHRRRRRRQPHRPPAHLRRGRRAAVAGAERRGRPGRTWRSARRTGRSSARASSGPRSRRVRHVLTPTSRVTTKVRLRNAGAGAGRFTVRATTVHGMRGTWWLGGRDVSRRLTGDGLRTGVLAPGQRVTLRLVVTTNDATEVGDRRWFRIKATSSGGQPTTDRVAALVRSRAE